MASRDFSWAIPVMRAGYAGRALVYLAVAGLSLWAIMRGGQAQGTETALARLEGSGWGIAVLVLIALGMGCYAVWRLIDALYDLECYGTDGKGIIARIGMIVTGAVHLALGVTVIGVLLNSGSDSGGGSGIAKLAGTVMKWPGGRWIVGIAGIAVIGAGIYYINKGWAQKYRKHLAANHFTVHWNPALRAGVAAQGIIVAIIGGFLVFAAMTADPNKAAGVGKVFDWLASQTFGNILVILICIGLLGFALFCAVNAAYKVIPRASGTDIETLAQKLGSKAKRQMS
ncbi:DUF1206 domain-containing protein [Profundibacterium mesophilum]|uniref:DUF1206 domain-containing protein n=1 Tax=Profundibacterium mesophilum KAUST100406-0324 TaxID=1037889 RepID=A0A921NNR3_9RHOB|nr:DUF1206 domain-containing protein [Profundibacterium mesophilum]KAF0675201.1 hypothetical protein PMES_02464 [Profundibacterium mesophilum KAUST100406-0324]